MSAATSACDIASHRMKISIPSPRWNLLRAGSAAISVMSGSQTQIPCSRRFRYEQECTDRSAPRLSPVESGRASSSTKWWTSPTENRDGWVELVAASGSHLVVEGSPDFIRPGPSRLLSGKFPFETADIDIAEATSTTIIDSPLWNDLTSIGAGHVPGKGFANHIGVDIVTDEMRNWLLLSPGLVYVQPIVQRPAGLRYRQAVRAITIG